MSPDGEDVLRRLERLEQQNASLHRQNRLLKLAGLAGACLAFLAAVSCQSKPAPAPASKTVEAEKFILKDASGKDQALFVSSKNGPALIFLDPDDQDKPRLGLLANRDGSTLSLYDTAGKERLRVGCNKAGPSVVLLGADDRPLAGLTATDKVTALELIGTGRPARRTVHAAGYAAAGLLRGPSAEGRTGRDA